VLLADFDLMAGSLGFYLNLEPQYSLVDLIQQADPLDHGVWSTAMVDADGIDVLPAPPIPFTKSVEQGGLRRVLEHARTLYEWIIVDLPNIFERISLLTLSEADRAFLIATSELSSLHLARRAMKRIAQLGLDSQKVQVLINRMDERGDLNVSDLTKLFECRVDTTLPSDPLGLQRGITMGRPLDADTHLGKAVDGIAGKLIGMVNTNPAKPARRASFLPLLSQT
jgi:pilus assembly protein CpaE